MFAECIQGSLSFLIPDEEAQARGGARGGAPVREAPSPRAPALEPCEFPGGWFDDRLLPLCLHIPGPCPHWYGVGGIFALYSRLKLIESTSEMSSSDGEPSGSVTGNNL